MTVDELRAFVTSLQCPPAHRAAYEIALQLAELNAKLEPDALFDTFKLVGKKIEAMDRGRR
jgi:hypothetical protein